MTHSVVFLTAGPLEWGSSRMRAFWVAKNIKGALALPLEEAIENGIPDAECYVFQKSFSIGVLNDLKAREKLLYWDVCDPLWWWEPDEVRRVLPLFDGFAASSQNLGDDLESFAEYTINVRYIPDRLCLEHYNRTAEHRERPVTRFVWFGVSVNRITIYGALPMLERLEANHYPVQLTVIDDAPNTTLGSTSFPVFQTRWRLNREVDLLTAHDIALLPNYPGPWGCMKSNNKTLSAWACGLPVTDGDDYEHLEALTEDLKLREDLGAEGRLEVEDMWNVTDSARDWERLLWG